MSTYSKQFFSGSDSGRPIQVNQTSSPGSVVHTTEEDSVDEVWIWASNSGSSAETLTIQFGGTSDSDSIVIVDIQEKTGLVLLVPGIPLTGGNSVRVFSSSAADILVSGFVNRISE